MRDMKIKKWILEKAISLSDWLLRNQDCADDQNEVNEVVSMRNYFVRQLKKLEANNA